MAVAVLSGCALLPPVDEVPDLQPPPTPIATVPPETTAPVQVEIRPLVRNDEECSGRFVAHTLDHETTVPGGDTVRMFEANGGGVGIQDLDDDGDLDIVLANHAGANTILWNEGDLIYRTQRLAHGDSRAVTLIDVDGDGRQDIVFSRRVTAPSYWHNEGGGGFSQQPLPGIGKPIYAINWGDLDGDGDLDLVGATYDAAMLTEFGFEYLASGNAGVYVYEQSGQGFSEMQLADGAQALALVLVDIDGDGRDDIYVGNDFAVPDGAWLRKDGGWQPFAFETMSHSTMSVDFGDIDNDGTFEIFTTDMMPYDDDLATEAAWQPVIDDMMEDPQIDDDPQIMSNMLQLQTGIIGYQNVARQRGVDATGWSWSSKFGDLDQDGYLDLYVVNGFIEATTFAHLPDHELVEENQVFRNDGRGYFRPAPQWGLGSSYSGRGMSMGDLDGDGDLDIVINNLRGPAQLFENQLCAGESLLVDLHWPDSANTRALGATLTLYSSQGKQVRHVKAASGYISGDPARVHFGFPENVKLQRLDILWPDGETSSVTTPLSGVLMSVSRGE